jgi:hypothetical protein
MLFSLVYFLVGRVLGTGRGPDEERETESLVLRHQLRVLQRELKCPGFRRFDRVLLAATSMACPKTGGRRSSSGPRPCSAGTESSSAGSGHIRGVGIPAGHQSTLTAPRPDRSSAPRTRDGATSGSAKEQLKLGIPVSVSATTVRTILLGRLGSGPRRDGPTLDPVPPLAGL